MTSSVLPAAIVLPPWVAAVVVILLALRRPAYAYAFVVAGCAFSLLAAAFALAGTWGGASLQYVLGGWVAPYGIALVVDGISAVMAVLVAALSLVVVVYARPVVPAESGGQDAPYLAALALLVTALQGMVVTGDLFNLYVFVEIASIATYAILATGGAAASLASFRYLLLGTVGASFYLLGLASLFALTGTLNMADMAARLPDAGAPVAVTVALAFVVAGFTLKMALFPMHAWLPDAYSFAPPAATALVAGLVTKVNAYALLRVVYGVIGPAARPLDLPLADLLGWPAVLAIGVGSLMALAQRDLKRLLAYSSIGHIGYIALGIGLGNPAGLVGALLHIVAHGLGKGGLFLVAGRVAYRSGSTEIDVLRGVVRRMPASAHGFLIAALSLVGIPPTIGFFSKWYLLVGCIDAGRPVFAVAILAATLLGLWYFWRVIEAMYFASPPEPDPLAVRRVPEPPAFPVTALAALSIVLGLGSAFLVRGTLTDAAENLLHRPRSHEMHEVCHEDGPNHLSGQKGLESQGIRARGRNTFELSSSVSWCLRGEIFGPSTRPTCRDLGRGSSPAAGALRPATSGDAES